MAKPKPRSTRASAKRGARSRTDAQLVAALASSDSALSSAAVTEINARFAASPTDVTGVAALCDLGVRLTSRDALDRVGYTCLPPIAESLARGEHLPPAYDVLVSIFGSPEDVRLILRAVPEPRRTAIMCREIDRAATEGMGYMHARIFEFMDLTPEALQYFIDRPDVGDDLSRVVGNSELQKHARRSSRIKKLLVAARALHKKGLAARPRTPPPAPKPKGPLSFTFRGIVDVANAKDLTGVELAQWRAAASAYFVGDVTTAAQFRKKLKAHGLDGNSGQMRRWTVHRGKIHAYDLWIIAVDNGVVFPANQPTRAGVYLIQDDWQATDESAASSKLEQDFIASAPRDLWTPR